MDDLLAEMDRAVGLAHALDGELAGNHLGSYLAFSHGVA